MRFAPPEMDPTMPVPPSFLLVHLRLSPQHVLSYGAPTLIGPGTGRKRLKGHPLALRPSSKSMACQIPQASIQPNKNTSASRPDAALAVLFPRRDLPAPTDSLIPKRQQPAWQHQPSCFEPQLQALTTMSSSRQPTRASPLRTGAPLSRFATRSRATKMALKRPSRASSGVLRIATQMSSFTPSRYVLPVACMCLQLTPT
ncbi:hypothetical protein CDV31_016522 [Fusarium ambrosium]|uniref:Uncharacterized protein n=1 Tax=Fusarium ambrosium TaxID=131363 RepID=A0A428S767_9HYPO|nr:hypothetical protein CDV31_016522 [Fusarium ambrosium]